MTARITVKSANPTSGSCSTTVPARAASPPPPSTTEPATSKPTPTAACLLPRVGVFSSSPAAAAPHVAPLGTPARLLLPHLPTPSSRRRPGERSARTAPAPPRGWCCFPPPPLLLRGLKEPHVAEAETRGVHCAIIVVCVRGMRHPYPINFWLYPNSSPNEKSAPTRRQDYRTDFPVRAPHSSERARRNLSSVSCETWVRGKPMRHNPHYASSHHNFPLCSPPNTSF